MLPIHLDRIDDGTLTLDRSLEGTDFPLLKELSRKGGIAFHHPVRVLVSAILADETILIQGAVKTVVQITCSRCLIPFDLPIDTEFSLTAAPKTPFDSENLPDEEIELRPDEMDLIYFTGNQIDLTDEVSQQVIMVFPIKPLCRKECKGLCSRCGADLNTGGCTCVEKSENNPFSALKGLSFPNRKE